MNKIEENFQNRETFLNYVFNQTLKLLLKENRFKRFAQDINTKKSLNSERVELYSRK